MAFVYCARVESEKQRADPTEILRAILKQLSSSDPNSPVQTSVVQAYEEKRKEAEADGSEPDKLTIAETTELTLDLLQTNPATIILDALDECTPNLRHELMTALENIISKSANVVKIFVSSRDDTDIVLRLGRFPSIVIQGNDNHQDIKRFVDFEVHRAISDKLLLDGQVSDLLKERVIKTLVDRSNGM